MKGEIMDKTRREFIYECFSLDLVLMCFIPLKASDAANHEVRKAFKVRCVAFSLAKHTPVNANMLVLSMCCVIS